MRSDDGEADDVVSEHRDSRGRTWRQRHRVLVWGTALLLFAAPVVALAWETEQGPAPLPQRPSTTQGLPPAVLEITTWPEGEAGIVVPEAVAVGEFTAEQVAAAYERVRRVVVASRLDLRVLRDHDVEPVLALLAPAQQGPLRKAWAEPDRQVQTAIVNRIATGEKLAPGVPPVTGTMRAQVRGGGLEVRADYSVSYVFATGSPPPGRPAVVSRTDMTYLVTFVGDVPQVEVGPVHESTHSATCKASPKGFIAPPGSAWRKDNC
ncbi:hypothetical protein ABZ816_27350 [Actinosynnema sp. NPDC047251]|uniref:Uncharacterized protein n=1 Tax=Saccharothrix espanaensis (strain ATCC 51144 / DSM 44229 / JCM 9112 / NBRC 15066 / NRRL 15764) TaxID=1179773 RepID=K0JWY9_SACES|nr:hypothetical protein [Saccharothrix espanaensis]CCH28718.1 hypothetical protein BN6_13920 [Saccharothrix espanaensis DSM 44229]